MQTTLLSRTVVRVRRRLLAKPRALLSSAVAEPVRRRLLARPVRYCRLLLAEPVRCRLHPARVFIAVVWMAAASPVHCRLLQRSRVFFRPSVVCYTSSVLSGVCNESGQLYASERSYSSEAFGRFEAKKAWSRGCGAV